VIDWKSTLHIPESALCSDMAKDLIFKLCTDEEKRLGNNGANEIKAHPFFNGIDFSGNLRKTKALYVPEIKYPTDTSNFEPIENKVLETHKSPEKNRQQMLNNNCNTNNNANKYETTQNINSNSNDANNSKNPIMYEFTFRRFFDEAYSEHFNVQSDNEDNEQNMYFQRKQLSKKNNEILRESFKRKGSENENPIAVKENTFYNNNNRPDTSKTKDDDQPAIYV
jgi:serine/threonine-protein kinase LATS1/2